MNKRVVLSTDWSSTYFFMAPITCLVWQKITGYTPIFFHLDNSQLDNQKCRELYSFCINYTKSMGFECHEIKHPPGRRRETIPQISRILASSLPLSPDSYILTADIDMWPLQHKWFNQQNPAKDFHIFYANAYGHTKYPICYLGGLASIWRDIMQIKANNINDAIADCLDQYLPADASSDDNWQFDEKHFFSKLSQWKGYKSKCQMIERDIHGQPMGRLDRSVWNYAGLNGMIDSHLLRPLQTDNNWPRIKRLMSDLLSSEDVSKFEQYRDEYNRLEKA